MTVKTEAAEAMGAEYRVVYTRDALATALEDDEAAENAVLVEQFHRMRL